MNKYIYLIIILLLATFLVTPAIVNSERLSDYDDPRLEDGLEEYWQLNETSGQRGAEIDLGNHQLNVYDTVSYSASNWTNAVSLSGTGYLSTSGVNLDSNQCGSGYPTDGITIIGWFYVSGSGRQHLIHSGDNAAGTLNYTIAYDLYSDSTAKLTMWINDTSDNPKRVTHSTTLSSSTWYFFAAGYDCDNDVVWLSIDDDGRETTSSTTMDENSNQSFDIGRYYTTGAGTVYKWNGRIDEVAFWSRSLSNDEILDLYNDGLGCVYPFDDCQEPIGSGTGENILVDGGMEDWPTSSGWYGVGIYPPGSNVNFGRVNYDHFNSDGEKELFFRRHGNPLCGKGMQYIGAIDTGLIGSGIAQDFDWIGGTLYYKFAVHTGINGGANTELNAYLVPIGSTGTTINLLSNQLVQNIYSWEYLAGRSSSSVEAGRYRLVLTINDLLAGTTDGYDPDLAHQIYLDDVAIGYDELPDYCQEDLTGSGTPTVTPTVTYTPTKTPAPLIIANCDFESGQSGWNFNSESYVALAGGPLGPQYAIARGSSPSITQYFTTTTSGLIYVSSWANGYPDIYAVNRQTGIKYNFYPSKRYPTDWTFLDLYNYLPKGDYYLALNHGPLGQAGYDGVSISANNQAYCRGVYSQPTSGPTAFVTATKTPTYAVTPTASRTPIPTATRTPFPQWSPTPTGTITPIVQPPQQPPAVACNDCIRPVWDGGWLDTFRLGQLISYIGWWLDYYWCLASSFFAWGPDVLLYIQTMWLNLSAMEPFGTFLELDLANKAMQLVISMQEPLPSGGMCFNLFGIPSSYSINFSQWLSESNSWFNNPAVDFDNSGGQYSINYHCQLFFQSLFPNILEPGICSAFAVFCVTNLWAWIIAFLNIAAIIYLFRYIYVAFIKPNL